MKKTLALLFSLLLTALLACCGGQPSEPTPPEGAAQQPSGSTERRQLDTLRIAFVPSHDPQEILEATEPLKGMLQTELAAQGIDVGSFEIDVGETYEAVGERLRDGTADVGVGMPGGTYVRYDDGCDVILTATRDGLSKDYDDAKSWNDGMPTVPVDRQTVFYRALLIAGPSEAGMAAAEKVNAGKELTWAELDALNWSVMGTTSSAGYIYPSLWLDEHYGKGVADLRHTVQANSYSDAFARLAAGEVDALLTYADARREYADQWDAEFGREVTIWEETSVIGVTAGIYNDTVTVSKASAVMDERLIAALQEAFIRIGDTAEGQATVAFYGHKGYQRATASDYDNERAAQQLIQKLSAS